MEKIFNKDNFKISIVGLLAGIVSGLFSSGGGMILVPAFVFLNALGEKQSRATAIFCILPLVITSGIIYYRRRFY